MSCILIRWRHARCTREICSRDVMHERFDWNCCTGAWSRSGNSFLYMNSCNDVEMGKLNKVNRTVHQDWYFLVVRENAYDWWWRRPSTIHIVVYVCGSSCLTQIYPYTMQAKNEHVWEWANARILNVWLKCTTFTLHSHCIKRNPKKERIYWTSADWYQHHKST